MSSEAIPCRFGLLGTGFWSSFVPELVQKLGTFSIERVWSRTPEKAAELAGKIAGAGRRPCGVMETWDQMHGLDGVIFALPPSEMPRALSRAVENGIPSIVEKPVARDSESLESLRRTSETASAPVAVHLQGRFVPVMHALRRRAREGEFGAVREVTVSSMGNWNHPNAPTPHTWKHLDALGGGILGVSGPHAAEFISSLIGPGQLLRRRTWVELRQRKDSQGVLQLCTAADNALIVREHPDDVVSVMRLSSTSRKKQEVWTVRCANGTLQMTASGSLSLRGNDGADEMIPCSREDVLRTYDIAAGEPFLSASDKAFPSMVFLELFLRWIHGGTNRGLPDLSTMITCQAMMGE